MKDTGQYDRFVWWMTNITQLVIGVLLLLQFAYPILIRRGVWFDWYEIFTAILFPLLITALTRDNLVRYYRWLISSMEALL